MSIFTNLPKNSISPSNLTKHSASLSTLSKTIHPWKYNQVGFKYNQTIDTATIYSIYYNGIGQESFSNLTKH